MLYPDGTFFSIFTLVSLRYILLAGLAFLIWYVLRKKKVAFKKNPASFSSTKRLPA